MKTLRFDFELDDQGVADLARLSDQHEIWLRCRDLTLKGLGELQRLRGIKKLSVGGSSIGAAEATALLEVAGLTSLVLYNGQLAAPALPVLRSAPALQELHLIDTGIPGAEVLRQYAASVDWLHCWRSSIILGFSQPRLSITVTSKDWTYNLAELSQAQELRYLRVEPGGDGTGLDFSRLKNLQEVVWVAIMPESQVSQLGALTELKKLVLRVGPGVSPSAFEPLRGLRNLENLDLTLCQVTDKHLTFLEGLTALRELHLSENPLQGECLRHLRNLPQLQRLSLQDCHDFDEAHLRHLAAIGSLTYLSLQYTPVSDKGLKALYGMPNLSNVLLLRSRVTAAGRSALKANLPVGKDVF
jgi:hypothetical protein